MEKHCQVPGTIQFLDGAFFVCKFDMVCHRPHTDLVVT